MSTILLLDTNYLAHRAFYSTGHLSHDGEGTGILYGILQTVDQLQDRFATDKVVFAFDRGYVGRTEIFPDYKANRYKKEKTEEELEQIREFRKQLSQIRDKWLPMLGYRNVFWQNGYEADDVIASLSFIFPFHSANTVYEFIIVSSDKDLWQLVNQHVRCYNPQTQVLTTWESFQKEWGVDPEMWPHVKAIAGDPSDGIPGVKGVGLKTAAKYYSGGLKEDSAVYKRIIGEGVEIHNRNIKLIRLPFPGTEKFELREDRVTAKRREKVFRKLGFAGGRVRGVRKRKRKEVVETGGFF
ncbi:hypothetical protein LCGC14_0248610 [marine sediment metagenome]|uniref:5'-3' exonuclease domain-containing protein n=1 Tax=marine sediment metagenome TaxID=412755 RepID=A0A0F9U9N2_9ZZZZ